MLFVLTGAIVQIYTLTELVDRAVAMYFVNQRDSLMGRIARLLTDFGKGHWFIIPAAGCFVLFRFIWQKPLHASRALFVLSSVVITGIIVSILKVVFGRARPNLFVSQDIFEFYFFRFGRDFNSFPSGHTACAMSAGIALAIIFPKYRLFPLVIGVFLAATRFITTAHYISDVVASSILAIFVVLTIQVLFDRVGLPLNKFGELPGHAESQFYAKLIGANAIAHRVDTGQTNRTRPTMFGVVATVATTSALGFALILVILEWQKRVNPELVSLDGWWLWIWLVVCVGFVLLVWALKREGAFG
jgi:membrane-associated phospholipid phosphatase